ncbi:hypothetical protein JAAARDRAFT_133415 [Jaapia argillacea MUCL 33604]|uniref:Cytochrome b561 domain-containing protein n=1 Tax=Jaapia argillacea MUCL 33604 TaxID=933084 RepID=A0A067PLE7_9AGAM|nr:hypothetical protein JAAARDRAFT_133415 [Jaapia argillacea MUCL 33604]
MSKRSPSSWWISLNLLIGQLLCVSATVNGTNVDYVVQSTGIRKPGWMALGFGTEMSNSAMVIMWANSNGNITLSQRSVGGHDEPQVVSNPPRVAALTTDLSTTNGSDDKFVFTIPADSSKTQNLIYAFGDQNPGSSAVDAHIEQHLSFGSFTLNLANTNTNITLLANPALGYKGTGAFLTVITIHAILCSVGFLILLPSGALLARYLRTFNVIWFKGHWIIQFYLAGPAIIVGIVFGFLATGKAGRTHFYDNHQQVGYGILVLYLLQCGLGAFIHWVKFKRFKGRPPQNYLHAILGLIVIGAALMQVRSGYSEEWPSLTGETLTGINILWWIWVVALPVAYLGGLVFLRKQYRQEAANRAKAVGGSGSNASYVGLMNVGSSVNVGDIHDDPHFGQYADEGYDEPIRKL